MKKRTFKPVYRLSKEDEDCHQPIHFVFNGCIFVFRRPFFGVNKILKTVLNWAVTENTPPVVSISYDKPTKPVITLREWTDEDYKITYRPFSSTYAKVYFLGDDLPKNVKVYLCKAVKGGEVIKRGLLASKTVAVIDKRTVYR